MYKDGKLVVDLIVNGQKVIALYKGSDKVWSISTT